MTAIPTYDAEQLAGLLAILPDVDAVELKLSVPDTHRRSAIAALGIDALDAVLRQVAFIDTPELSLSSAGVVLRARRTQRKPGDVTVKLRPMLPADAPADLRQQPGFKVEVDASPAGYVCSCSLTSEVSDRKVKRLLAGSLAISDVLDGTQLGLLRDHLPTGVEVGDIGVLGVVHLLKCKFNPVGFPRRMVAELWMLPDGTQILELSTKAEPADAFQAAAETKVLLAQRGLDLSAPQETKTRAALAALTADRAASGG